MKKNRSDHDKKYYQKNKEAIKELSKKYYHKNKEKSLLRKKKWKEKNKEKYRIISKKYYYRNRKKIIKDNTKRQKIRLKTDLNFKLLNNLRRRILHALKGNSKSNKTIKLLGVDSIEFVWNHLEKSFKPGMTRENHGKWHVDHIKPCSSFDLTKASEQRECFHYTNLQPLWASENLSKGNRIS